MSKLSSIIEKMEENARRARRPDCAVRGRLDEVDGKVTLSEVSCDPLARCRDASLFLPFDCVNCKDGSQSIVLSSRWDDRDKRVIVTMLGGFECPESECSLASSASDDSVEVPAELVEASAKAQVARKHLEDAVLLPQSPLEGNPYRGVVRVDFSKREGRLSAYVRGRRSDGTSVVYPVPLC